MDSETFYTATIDDVKGWQDGGGEFLSPQAILTDLTEAQASTVPAGSPYSIAQVLAHMHYWQGGRFAKLRGEEWPEAAHLIDTFALPSPGGWDALVTAFLRDLDSVKALANEKAEYDYVSRALHNGYHLGQIVLLRQMLGIWPPAAGESYDF